MAKKKKEKKIKVKRGTSVTLKEGIVKKRTSKGVLLNKMRSGGGAGNKRIGSFGGIVFRVTALMGADGKRIRKILSPSDINQEIAGNWADHSIIGKKPKSEFLGPDLRSLTFQIVVDVQLGYKPHAILKKINRFVEEGKVDIFVLGTHKIGTGKWKMEKASEAFNLIYNEGQLARATVDITLGEYF